MKALTMRDLNRKTATVLDAVERGEVFELHRNGKVVAYLSANPPAAERQANWEAHFEWLRRQSKEEASSLLGEFEEERRRLRAREADSENRK